MSATLQDNLEKIGNPMVDALTSRGITPDTLARQLKAELKAKETKFIKLKKNTLADEVIKQIQDIGEIDGKKKGKLIVIDETTEEKVIAVNMIAWGVRQKAREDAQKLLDLYPNTKIDITDNTIPTYTEEERQVLKDAAIARARQQIQELRNEHGD